MSCYNFWCVFGINMTYNDSGKFCNFFSSAKSVKEIILHHINGFKCLKIYILYDIETWFLDYRKSIIFIFMMYLSEILGIIFSINVTFLMLTIIHKSIAFCSLTWFPPVSKLDDSFSITKSESERFNTGLFIT